MIVGYIWWLKLLVFFFESNLNPDWDVIRTVGPFNVCNGQLFIWRKCEHMVNTEFVYVFVLFLRETFCGRFTNWFWLFLLFTRTRRTHRRARAQHQNMLSYHSKCRTFKTFLSIHNEMRSNKFNLAQLPQPLIIKYISQLLIRSAKPQGEL